MGPTSQSSEELAPLSSVLWKYRALLVRVEFRLEAQLLFSSTRGDHRLVQIADLMEETATSIGELDLHRELILSADGLEMNGASPSLSELCEQVDAPWDQVFRDHQRWFTNSVERIGHVLDQNRLNMGSAMETIARLADVVAGTPSSEGYDRQGHQLRSGARPLLFDGRA
jgi:hypothetical protein